MLNEYDVRMGVDKLPTLIKINEIGSEAPTMLSPEQISAFMKDCFDMDKLTVEQVYLLAMNTKIKPVAVFKVSSGTVDSSVFSARDIFMRALLSGASRIVLVHNHPSGDTHPSKEDIKVTEKIANAGKLLNIELLDHIIIGDDYFSFREEKYL